MREVFSRRARIPHRSTIFVVVLFVLVPWTLVAIPGRCVDSVGWSGAEYTIYYLDHGWPALHSRSRRAYVRNKIRRPAVQMMLKRRKPAKGFWDLAFDEAYVDQVFDRSPFWTNPDRWPLAFVHRKLAPGEQTLFRGQIHLRGLIVNLLLVGLVCVLVGRYCEQRIERLGSLTKFRLRELAVMLTILVVALASVCNEYRRVRREAVDVEYLAATIGYGINEGPEYCRLPELLLRLLNNHTKVGGYDLFHLRARPGQGYCRLETLPPVDERAKVLRVLGRVPAIEGMVIGKLTPEVTEYLQDVPTLSVTSLELGAAKGELDFAILKNMPNLRALSLSLPATNTRSQADVLRPLLDCPHLRFLKVNGLDEDGANLILQMHELDDLFCLPPVAGLSPQLRAKLVQRFPLGGNLIPLPNNAIGF